MKLQEAIQEYVESPSECEEQLWHIPGEFLGREADESLERDLDTYLQTETDLTVRVALNIAIDSVQRAIVNLTRKEV